ncbi:AAA family ATPase [Telmatocola sphagniphila]|uniref:Uncharacterized AAA domain-containing protein ycf46 n=1 Tax=Telmatocola sphagniphila TaxID=1123043 RepID=A0A8E6B1B9_9BACT|nr:AAA family ATPase [Telmatocola sphagniphila]QVL29953.1 AAA family ATPase [Telmatocola sphagniphila]
MLAELKLLITAGNPIITIDTREEERAAQIVRKVAEELCFPLFEWAITRGLQRTIPTVTETGIKPGKAPPALEYILDNKGNREIYLFYELAAHTRDPIVARQLQEIYNRSTTTLILINRESLPETINRMTVPVTLKLPDAGEVEFLVKETYRSLKETSYVEISSSLTKREMEQLVQSLRGLTTLEINRIIRASILEDYALSSEDLPRVVEMKRNLLKSAGCLESIGVNFAPEDIGGLASLKKWLSRRRGGMSSKARAFGLDPPRGILLLGVQGCGKSLCAKIVAADWGMPLLRMDPGVLYQKFIGESENRLREALAQAESMAPVILWIDEIEKAFASSSSSSADGGLSQRMFGTLLTWMQDHRSPIFMVATANNISALPPELMRKGRFDEIFFVDLPNDAVRRDIWKIHLQRRQRDPKSFNLERLAAKSEGFSGAEIEQAVISGMFVAFAERCELSDDLLIKEIETTRPLYKMMSGKINKLRRWAKNRCVSAE